jgi:hypothetical protein
MSTMACACEWNHKWPFRTGDLMASPRWGTRVVYELRDGPCLRSSNRFSIEGRSSAQGWTDAMRKLQPNGRLWTFWDYKRERWPNDKGMRLDHFLLSPQPSKCLVDGGVDRWVRGEVNASDHAPVWIELTSSRASPESKSGAGVILR